MPRKLKARPPEPLAPIPAEILDQFVRQGPLTPAELEATVRRFKKAIIEVFTDLKTRGCHDILIAVTDGLKGMSEALSAVFPATTLLTCIVHLLRHSLEFANWKQRKPMAAALRPIYTAAGDRYDQCARERQRAGAQDHQNPRALPDGRGRHQVDLAGVAQHHRGLVARGTGLEARHEPVRDPLRGSLHRPDA